jgi:hypothetical protein
MDQLSGISHQPNMTSLFPLSGKCITIGEHIIECGLGQIIFQWNKSPFKSLQSARRLFLMVFHTLEAKSRHCPDKCGGMHRVFLRQQPIRYAMAIVPGLENDAGELKDKKLDKKFTDKKIDDP